MLLNCPNGEVKVCNITYPENLLKTMCVPVICNQCEKYSWKGCGRHLPELYASIEKGRHCACRPWPGVVIPPAYAAEQPPPPPQQGNSTSSVAGSSATLKKA